MFSFPPSCGFLYITFIAKNCLFLVVGCNRPWSMYKWLWTWCHRSGNKPEVRKEPYENCFFVLIIHTIDSPWWLLYFGISNNKYEYYWVVIDRMPCKSSTFFIWKSLKKTVFWIWNHCLFDANFLCYNCRSGFLVANDEEQTSVPYVYGIGDILDGKPELTPVAIQAGRFLSKRLFGGSTKKVFVLINFNGKMFVMIIHTK